MMIFIVIFNVWSLLCTRVSLVCEIEFQAQGVCALHYDDDKTCEFIVHKEGRYYVTDQHLTSYFQLNPGMNACNFVACMDIDGNPPKELFFQAIQNDSVWVHIYSENAVKQKVMICTGEDNAPPQGWDGGVYGFSLCDFTDDGYKDLVFGVNSGFDLRPRGVYVYDLHNKTMLWKFSIGGSPRDIMVMDCNNDGEEEIIVSNTAVANGNSANGFDDGHSYVICLDATGSLVWNRRIGGTLSDLFSWVGDIDGDNEQEVVVAECEGSANSVESNRVYILNAETGETERYIACGAKYLGFVVHDVNRDEKLEILTGNTDGIIRVFNDELVPIRQRNMAKPSWVLHALDMNHDGCNEIVVRCGENILCILDEELNTLCEYETNDSKRIKASCVSEGERSKLLVFSGDDPPWQYSLLTMSGPTVLDTFTRQGSPFVFIIIGLMGAAVVILLWVQKRYHIKLKQQRESTDNMLEWSGLAQRLAHDIKNPLSTMNLTLQRLHDVSHHKFGNEAAVLDQYTDSVLEEVARLRDTTDKFMKILSIEKPQVALHKPEELIESALSRFAKRISDGIVLKRDFARTVPDVLCDRDQIIVVFSNIIENALDAMGNKGVFVLRIAVHERILKNDIQKFVNIEFEDNGKGFSPEHLDRVFKPFFTTKEQGTGIGLVIAREILRRNSGTHTISSKKDIGTVVTVQLPAGTRSKRNTNG